MQTISVRETRRRQPRRSEQSDPAGKSTAVGTKRIATNFLFLTVAEVICRVTSVFVTLALTERLGRAGYGRIEFGFNVVFWLVLIVRDGFEVIGARELARHAKLMRPLVNNVLAAKLILASVLYSVLAIVALTCVRDVGERSILLAYGLLLFTTAFGLDFAYRGIERMAIPAISLVIRTAVYAVGVLLAVKSEASILWVPLWLVAGEAFGISIVWVCHSRVHGIPRPVMCGRFAQVIFRRGRPILAICMAQTVLTTVDLMVVGLASTWTAGGLYSAPQRLISAAVTLGLIYQQVVFPTLSRAWRADAADTRAALDRIVRYFVTLFLPLAIGATVLAGPIIRFLFPSDFEDAKWILAIGIWRAPLLTIAFLYQATLIALNRERSASRYLFVSAASAPFVIMLGLYLGGLHGGAAAMVLVAGLLASAAFFRLRAEGRSPAWHHHLAKPLTACVAMSLVAIPAARLHVALGIACGAATYFATLAAIGGLDLDEIRGLFRKSA